MWFISGDSKQNKNKQKKIEKGEGEGRSTTAITREIVLRHKYISS